MTHKISTLWVAYVCHYDHSKNAVFFFVFLTIHHYSSAHNFEIVQQNKGHFWPYTLQLGKKKILLFVALIATYSGVLKITCWTFVTSEIAKV